MIFNHDISTFLFHCRRIIVKLDSNGDITIWGVQQQVKSSSWNWLVNRKTCICHYKTYHHFLIAAPEFVLFSCYLFLFSSWSALVILAVGRISDFSVLAGEDSGKVVIWDLRPVRREEDEKNESIPKLLCQMDNHLGENETVKWLVMLNRNSILIKTFAVFFFNIGDVVILISIQCKSRRGGVSMTNIQRICGFFWRF